MASNAAVELTLKIIREGEKELKETEKDLSKLQSTGKRTGDTLKAGFKAAAIALGSLAVAGVAALGSLAKESLKAAKAAGKLPEEFERAEKATERMKIAIGAYLGQEGKGLVDWFSDIKDHISTHIESVTMLSKAYEAGLIPKEEYKNILVDIREGEILAADAASVYADDLLALEGVTRDLKWEMKELNMLIGMDMAQSYDTHTQKLEDLKEKEADLIEQIDELGNSYLINYDKGKEAMAGLLDELDNVQTAIANTQDAWDEQAANYVLKLAEMALASEGWTAEELDRYAAMAEGLGLVTEAESLAAEAMRRLVTQSGITGDKMTAMAQEIGDALQEENVERLREILSLLKRMSSKTWKIAVAVAVSGASAIPSLPGKGGGGGQGETQPEFTQHGGPVFGGRHYIVGEAGPELLTMGGGSGYVTSNKDIVDYDLLATKISQAMLGPFEDFKQALVMALG